jgi:ketosteroid isomerase-like protein
MDRVTAQAWLDRYVAAWKSYDADDIAGLFSDDVRYRYYSYADWLVGRDAVVASWLGEFSDEDGSSRDAPGTYDAAYAPVAVDGDVVIATGTTTYTASPGGPVTQVFDNCFVMRFDEDGRCREFTEYYTKRP